MKLISNNIARRSLVSCAVMSALSVNIAFAQASDEATIEEQKVEKISVTGSLISRDPNLVAPSPVQAISAEEIQASGEFSIVDVINDVPALLGSTSAEMSIDSDFADGANILDLRGLGSERTLVLVNGRRHVGGVGGSNAVDVGSIPVKLIKSVDVLTGGASAIYGADAVSGVVNFILKDDYEGLEFDVTTGMATEGDAEQFTLSGLYGENFDQGKGNVTISLEYQKDNGLQVNQRDDGMMIGSGAPLVNIAKRFQRGQIDASSMPNLARYYNYENTGNFGYGQTIPTAEDFNASFLDSFGEAATLTNAEQALFAAAASAPAQAVHPMRSFPMTSGWGTVGVGVGGSVERNTDIDVDGNGTPDCLESFLGYATPFSYTGGCWTINPDGSYRPTQDGLVADLYNGFGGDAATAIQQQNGYLILPSEKLALNINSVYDINAETRLFGEFKFVSQETENEGMPSSFYDLLYGYNDNPFLPEFLKPAAEAAGGLSLTIDPVALGQGKIKQERETVRAVVGIEGTIGDNYDYQISANYGRFSREQKGTEDQVIVDRFFAAIDAVTDPVSGDAACRSSVDPTAEMSATPYGIPSFETGYFSFTPGDGSCVPLNLWAGVPGMSQQAIDWITTDSSTQLTIEQFVFNANIQGDTSEWFELPYGAIAFATGFEYREETSDTRFNAMRRGVLPEGTPFTPGQLVSEVSGNNSLVFRPATLISNIGGEYDVSEVFVQASLPLINDEFLAEDLTLDMAARYSDYSTIGKTLALNANIFWSPIEQLAIRATKSKSVRAPNISELFTPELGATYRPTDVCGVDYIDAIASETTKANLTQNCQTYFDTILSGAPTDSDGNYAFTDPLTAAFAGVEGGNPNLQEETADTSTIGFVYQSEFVEGLTLSVDYWNIEIEDAVASITSDDIVKGCYEGASLNNVFCSQFTRNNDQSSPFYGGFNFLRTGQINFASLETAGVDFQLGYSFDVGEHGFGVKLAGTKLSKLDRYSNPLDLTEIDDELTEAFSPELAGNLTLSWNTEDLTVAIQSQYVGEQLLEDVEVKDFNDGDFGSEVLMGEFFTHDLNASYQISEKMSVYGGINNVTNEKPFITSYAYPVGPRGRYAFIGVNFKL